MWEMEFRRNEWSPAPVGIHSLAVCYEKCAVHWRMTWRLCDVQSENCANSKVRDNIDSFLVQRLVCIWSLPRVMHPIVHPCTKSLIA